MKSQSAVGLFVIMSVIQHTRSLPLNGGHRYLSRESSLAWLKRNCQKTSTTRLLNTFAPHEKQVWECVHYPRILHVVNCYTRCHNPLNKRYMTAGYITATRDMRITLVNPSNGCEHVTLALPTMCECRAESVA